MMDQLSQCKDDSARRLILGIGEKQQVKKDVQRESLEFRGQARRSMRAQDCGHSSESRAGGPRKQKKGKEAQIEEAFARPGHDAEKDKQGDDERRSSTAVENIQRGGIRAGARGDARY
jgi:hypothetical protein